MTAMKLKSASVFCSRQVKKACPVYQTGKNNYLMMKGVWSIKSYSKAKRSVYGNVEK